MSFDAIRQGFKAVVEATVPGLTVYAYPPEGGLSYPCLIVEQVGNIEYSPILQQGGFDAPLLVGCYVHSGKAEDGLRQMEAFKYPNGDTSIFAAVNVDHTLDASCKHAWVQTVGEMDTGRNEPANRWEYYFQIMVRINGSVS